MSRDIIGYLSDEHFDLVVVGGGIFAACAAWDAVLRGLKVALIEKEDFCSGTSANSFKMIHGGIRYLQHADVVRLWSSCRERSAMLRIAPHLVQPLPIVIPTYGYGKSGKWFLGAGMLLYDLLTLGRNRGIRDPARHIPLSRFLSREEVLGEYPDLEKQGLTGAALFY
ncbi:MAG: FAD-dependent oxidoreductase, partial [Gammaproteobacteria bacterium]|nr:FAD-dependent oxidoreductase [Gammaproteobacteria bacterium]